VRHNVIPRNGYWNGMNSIEGSAYHKCFIRILITQRNILSLGLLIQSSGDLIEFLIVFVSDVSPIFL